MNHFAKDLPWFNVFRVNDPGSADKSCCSDEAISKGKTIFLAKFRCCHIAVLVQLNNFMVCKDLFDESANLFFRLLSFFEKVRANLIDHMCAQNGRLKADQILRSRNLVL